MFLKFCAKEIIKELIHNKLTNNYEFNKINPNADGPWQILSVIIHKHLRDNTCFEQFHNSIHLLKVVVQVKSQPDPTATP